MALEFIGLQDFKPSSLELQDANHESDLLVDANCERQNQKSAKLTSELDVYYCS